MKDMKDMMLRLKQGNLGGKSLFMWVMSDFIHVIKDIENHALHSEGHDYTR